MIFENMFESGSVARHSYGIGRHEAVNRNRRGPGAGDRFAKSADTITWGIAQGMGDMRRYSTLHCTVPLMVQYCTVLFRLASPPRHSLVPQDRARGVARRRSGWDVSVSPSMYVR